MDWLVIVGLWFGAACNIIAAIKALLGAGQQEYCVGAILKTLTQVFVAVCGAMAARYLGAL